MFTHGVQQRKRRALEGCVQARATASRIVRVATDESTRNRNNSETFCDSTVSHAAQQRARAASIGLCRECADPQRVVV